MGEGGFESCSLKLDSFTSREFFSSLRMLHDLKYETSLKKTHQKTRLEVGVGESERERERLPEQRICGGGCC